MDIRARIRPLVAAVAAPSDRLAYAQEGSIKNMEFAVLDGETAGLYPGGHDRIVEIAVVKITGAGEILDEYATLVNPRRDLGPVGIHGIHATAVISAPLFEDIAGDVADRISDLPL